MGIRESLDGSNKNKTIEEVWVLTYVMINSQTLTSPKPLQSRRRQLKPTFLHNGGPLGIMSTS